MFISNQKYDWHIKLITIYLGFYVLFTKFIKCIIFWKVTKLNNITKNLLRKIEVSEKELKEIRTQYHDSQDDNTEFRQNLLKVWFDFVEQCKLILSWHILASIWLGPMYIHK